MRSSAILASVALLVIPIAIFFERADLKTWNNRLIVPSFEEEPNRHTPLQTDGTFLPPRITEDTTLTPEHNPVILTSRTEIPVGITVTFAPGTHVYAHEFAELAVFGVLYMQGSETQPVQAQSNEAHPQNQIWNGIIIQPGGQAEISHTIFRHASPALTCLKDSTASLANSEIHEALIGIFTESPNCIVSDNRIQTIRDEIVSKL